MEYCDKRAERTEEEQEALERGRKRRRTRVIEKEGEWPGGIEGTAGPGWLVLCARVRVGM